MKREDDEVARRVLQWCSVVIETMTDKSALNTLCQKTWQRTPVYATSAISRNGKPMCETTVSLPNGTSFSAVAETRKTAELEAARIACESIAAIRHSSASPMAIAAHSGVAFAAAPSADDLVPHNQNHLVLAKMLDVFRHALLRPLRATLVSEFGNDWIDRLRQSDLPAAVRDRIDAKMLNWDVVCVHRVAQLLVLEVHGRSRDAIDLLARIGDAARNRVAHHSRRSEEQLRRWAPCKALIAKAIAFLELWNDLFDSQVDRNFIRQLRDIASGAGASLIEAPIIQRSEVAFSEVADLAIGGAASVRAATFRGDGVAVKQFSPTSSLTIEHAIRKELQTMVRLRRCLTILTNMLPPVLA